MGEPFVSGELKLDPITIGSLSLFEISDNMFYQDFENAPDFDHLRALWILDQKEKAVPRNSSVMLREPSTNSSQESTILVTNSIK
jgi:hypothetical protein